MKPLKFYWGKKKLDACLRDNIPTSGRNICLQIHVIIIPAPDPAISQQPRPEASWEWYLAFLKLTRLSLRIHGENIPPISTMSLSLGPIHTLVGCSYVTSLIPPQVSYSGTSQMLSFHNIDKKEYEENSIWCKVNYHNFNTCTPCI